MNRKEHQATQADMWRTVFNTQRATFTAVAETLLHSNASPEQILEEALTAVEGSPIRDHFAQVSAVRAVVKVAIAHNREGADSPTGPESAGTRELPGNSPLSVLPWPERAVYFLRLVLRYSRRDTALLLGMSDANIDQLHEFAERRIGDHSNPSFSSLTNVLSMPRG